MTNETKTTLCLLLSLVTWNGRLHAQSSVREFVSFNHFHDGIKAANSSRPMRPGAFGEMRQHILDMYRGVEVSHSFVRNSSHFDCVPVEQQPTVRMLGLDSIAAAPPQSMLAKPSDADDDRAELAANPTSQLVTGKSLDEFGNSVGCAEHTIPLRRITLDEMTQFPTLRQYLDKRPDASALAAEPDLTAIPATAAASHKYSFMEQTVNNLGGNSNLNLWSPYVNTALGEVFSLSQEWYVGGSGAARQTVEVGWQNFPAKYGSQDSRLFIYWTADGYSKTGCYNLECPAFVQVAETGILGGGFGAYSTVGGPQYEFSAEYHLYQGNWWLAIQGTWIGYYPGAIFKGGQLTRNAEKIQFGTESVGTTVWPAEGSGNWSTAGRNGAAYQRNLFYFNTSGASEWDSLTPVNPSPKCYSASEPYTSPSSGWTVFFYAGGPGGSGC